MTDRTAVPGDRPTTKIVYVVLATDGPLSADELVGRVGCTRRAVERAIHELDQDGHLVRHHDTHDARRVRYGLRQTPETPNWCSDIL